jgi:hypothetical protein
MMMESPGTLFLGSGILLAFTSMQAEEKSKRVFFIPSSFVLRHSLCHLTEAKFCVALDEAT